MSFGGGIDQHYDLNTSTPPAPLQGDAALARGMPELVRDGYSVQVGDCRERLAEMPENSAHVGVTSPPYFQLRTYATGAKKAQELGSEKTVAEFVSNLVAVGEAMRRVIRDDGLFFLNLGDTYNTNVGGETSRNTPQEGGRSFRALNSRAPAYTKGTGRGRDACVKPKSLLGIPWRVAFAMESAGWYLRKEIIWAKCNPMPESVMDRPTSSHETVFMFAKSTRNFWDKEAVREKGVIPVGTLGAKGSQERAGVAGVNARPPEYKVYDGRRNLRDVWWIQTKPFKGAHFATFPSELVSPIILGGTSAAGVCVACGTPRRRVTELVGVIPTSGSFGSTNSTNNPLAKWKATADAARPQRGLSRRAAPLTASGIPVRDTLAWDPGCGPSKKCRRCKGTGVIDVPADLPKLAPRQASLGDLAEAGEARPIVGPLWEPPPESDAMADGAEDCPRCMGYGEIRTGCTAEKPVPALVLDPFLGSGTTVVEALRLGRRGVGFDLSEEYLENYARPAIRAAARQPGLLGIG